MRPNFLISARVLAGRVVAGAAVAAGVFLGTADGRICAPGRGPGLGAGVVEEELVLMSRPSCA